MNLLIITPTPIYPLNSGGAQAQFNMIDQLREKHNITIVYIENRYGEKEAINTLKELWPNVKFHTYSIWAQLTYWKYIYEKGKRAFQILTKKSKKKFIIERIIKPYGIYFPPRFINFINNIITKENIDTIQVEFYPCLDLINYINVKVQKIFVHHEIRFVRNKRYLASFQLSEKEKELFNKIKTKEINDLNKYDTIITLTNKDKDILRENNVKTKIIVSPAAIKTNIHPYKTWNHKIIFLGGYGHIPNIEGFNWFIGNIISKMSTTDLNNSCIHIIGKGWPESLIANYNKKSPIKIIIHGFVENLYSVAKGSIMVIPILTGSGMRMKILEAAAMGIPFITTKVGVEGLNFTNEESCLIKNKPEDWIKALIKLTHHEEERKKLANNAQKKYIKEYSLQESIKTRNRVYQQNVKETKQ